MNVCIQDVTGWTDLAHQICSKPNINFTTVSRKNVEFGLQSLKSTVAI